MEIPVSAALEPFSGVAVPPLNGPPNVQAEPKRGESAMKCSNPHCNHGIGLVSYRRGVFGKGRYCSRHCRDTFVAEQPKRPPQERTATTYFEWLFLQPIENPRPALLPVRARAR
jgi:hypothetical protein